MKQLSSGEFKKLSELLASGQNARVAALLEKAARSSDSVAETRAALQEARAALDRVIDSVLAVVPAKRVD